MKKFKFLLIVMMAVMVSIMANHATAKDVDDTLFEEIKMSADSFEIAVEQNNFRAAKEQLDVLLPLIKKELKVAKKRMTDFQKAGDKALAKEEKIRLKRKNEIHDHIHAIVDESAAGLRVKAKSLTSLVQEYVNLLPDDAQLVTSN